MRQSALAAYLLLGLILVLIFGPAVSHSVGMGPSSILTVALAAGGIGPVPGYPVHNIFAKLLLLWPGLSPVFALNLTSFLFSVFSILLGVRLIKLMVKSSLGEELSPFALIAFGMLFGVLFFASPGLARVSFYCERYSTELFFVFLAANLALEGNVLGLAFLSTFVFFCHAKSLPLIWFFYGVGWLKGAGRRPSWSPQILCALCGVMLGTLALVVLSWRDPLFDWNNPENLTNLFNSFTRREYALIHLERSWADWIVDWQRQYRLVNRQFVWPVFLFGGVSFYFLARRSRFYLGAILAVILLTGEWTSFIQHYSNPQADPILHQLYDWMMLNYFAPYYALLAWLAVLGGALLYVQLSENYRLAAGGATLVAAMASAVIVAKAESAQTDRLSEELTADFEKAIPENGVLFTNVDSLFASLLYHQMKEGRLQHRVLLHTELMFRSWYLKDIEREYPEFWSAHKDRLESFRRFIEEFENSNFDESKFRFAGYLEKLNGLAAEHLDRGVYVYFDPTTHGMRQGLFFPFQWDPEVVAFRLRQGSYRIPDFDVRGMKFDQMLKSRMEGSIWGDRFLATFARIAELRLKRARMLQSEEVPRVEHFIEEISDAKRPLRP